MKKHRFRSPRTPAIKAREQVDQVRRRFLGDAVRAGLVLGIAPGTGFSTETRAADSESVDGNPPGGQALYKRGDDGYEPRRLDAVWNGRKPKRYPDAILMARNEDAVVEAVRLAREEGWGIGVRSGGHSWNASPVREGGLLLDLSYLNDAKIDLESETVSIGPAIRARDLQSLLAPHGYYVPTATCPSVGMGGFLLGGGASFTGRVDGVACNAIKAIDVVMADGRLYHADDTTYPELMWAARGGGPGFFGAITRFHLGIKPLPKSMLSSLLIFPLETADEFLQWSTQMLDSIPSSISVNWIAIESWLPQYQGTVFVLFPIAMGDSEEQTRAALEPYEQCPFLDRALVHQSPAPWTYDTGYGLLAQMYVKGRHYRADAMWVKPDDPGFLPPVKQMVSTLPSRHSHVLWAPWNVHAPLHPNSAYSLHTPLSVHPYGICDEEKDDAAMNAWVNQAMRSLEPHSIHGGKVNDAELAAYPKYVLSPENTTRLQKLRAKYDPDGLFHSYLGTPGPLS